MLPPKKIKTLLNWIRVQEPDGRYYPKRIYYINFKNYIFEKKLSAMAFFGYGYIQDVDKNFLGSFVRISPYQRFKTECLAILETALGKLMKFVNSL